MEKRPVKVTGSVTSAIDTFESFRESKRDRLVVASPVYASEKRIINVHWLSAAASTYGISADIRDYIIPIVPIVTSDIPNRNLQAFGFEELSKFDWMKGHMVYQSFIGKMTAANHVNDDPSHSRGVIFDASLQYVPRYDVWKVVLLCGFDRTKDRELVRDILNRKRTGYSMGALVETFECSVCGQDHECRCTKGSIVKGKLAYQLCKGVNYIETSSVESPADITAIGENLYV